MTENKIEQWVKLALQYEDLCDYTISTTGKSSKDSGYLGNIFFVTVKGKSKEQDPKVLNLVIKASKESEKLRQQMPLKEIFEKEIFVYDHIFTSFNNLQKEIGVENLLDFIPHCYVTKVFNNSELLVFDDLKAQGYIAWNRKIPMNFEHAKLALEAYGKFHAFSLALKQTKSDLFAKYSKNNINIFGHMFVKTGLHNVCLDVLQKAKTSCISSLETEILKHLDFSKEDARYILSDFYFEDSDYHVFSHGDCWVNNFMFKYDETANKPVKVCILDWQCSGLCSPVMDLSHFIYACCENSKIKNVSKFLKVYYNSLSKCLKVLDCNPDQVFPYAKLVQHWKKFSRYGAFLQPLVIKFEICEAEDAPDFAEAAEQGKEFLDNFNVEITDVEVYNKRIRENFVHYVENLKLSGDY